MSLGNAAPQHGGNVFAVARERGWRWQDIADFSASINPLGPSKSVEPAIVAALSRIAHYPETEPSGLREALAKHWGIAEECLMLGNGATELIYFLARTMPQQCVNLAAPVFSEFHRAFPRGRIVREPWPAMGLLIISRPVNPTGQIPELEPYLSSTDHPVLVDESFIEFTGEASLLPMVRERKNLMILRSLTKFYALPGLRIGALAASASTVREWRKQREPWQVNVLAEAAALAALTDHVHCNRSIEYILSEREWLVSQLAALNGVRPRPSQANYLLIEVDYPVEPLARHLLEAKILIRDCSGWPGVTSPNALRVAVRTHAENTRLIEAWREFRCS